MKIVENLVWVYYVADDYKFDTEKIGKWMYFFDDKEFVVKVCKEAVESGVVKESKHNNAEKGVSCFYLSAKDIEGHKRVITYFFENNLIPRTKTGRLYNISFKLDEQTTAGEYGEDFKATLKLADFLDLNTGEWLK